VDDIEGLFDEAAEAARRDEGEALALLALAVDQLNREFTPEGGNRERIEKLVKKLYETAHEIRNAGRARGFSISVGFPAGVSVSFDWD
jgi:hypothetical protein